MFKNRSLLLPIAAFAIAAIPLKAAATTGSSKQNESVGRPVRIISLSFHNQPLETIAGVIDREAGQGADLIALPEVWRGQQDGHEETLEGPTITAISALAKKYHTYIVCPLDRKAGNRRLNSAVLIDRTGKVVFVYDKVYPYWSEYDHKPPVSIASDVPVYDTDFGRIGIAICFDVNFPEVWQRLADKGAELVIWPSAYSAGTTLQAYALLHHYYVVSSTLENDCVVYDISGEEMLYQHTPNGINVARITLDLDRGVYHTNFNMDKRAKLLKERGMDVVLERSFQRESWFVLRAARPGVSARTLAHEYGLEELRDYLDRSRREIDRMRGQKLGQ
jgi:predicted amidohydrolase